MRALASHNSFLETACLTYPLLILFPKQGGGSSKRHPIYSSLMFLGWGIFFKSPSWPDARFAKQIVGLLASGCDLAYGLTFAFAPSLQVIWLASGGLFWMIWHLLVGQILFKISKE